MWVDEGDGQIPAQLAKAAAVLEHAPHLAGQMRKSARPLPRSRNASRPTIAARGATTVIAWLEWQEGRGDRLVAEVNQTAAVVVPGPEDLFRPTAAVTADGVPWLVFGRSGGAVGVWACRFVDGRWSDPEPVSDTDGPSFNQEVAAAEDGGLHVCWQGRAGGRFAVFARRWNGSGWEPTVRVSEEDIRATCGTRASRSSTRARELGVAYAWTEYVDGSYAVAVRRIDARGGAGPVRRLTGGSDYALHPSLATTTDGRLWCAFDVVSVHGHGGSGPTRLRPRPTRDGRADDHDGMREPGRSVPPELLPEVSAHIRVVRVDGDALVEPPGELARGLNVVPSALPRLQATADGGLVVALSDPPAATADDVLLGGGRPGARARRLVPADDVRRHRRHAGGGVAGRGPDRRAAGHPGRRAPVARPALERGVRRARVPLPRRSPRRRHLARRPRGGTGGAHDRRVGGSRRDRRPTDRRRSSPRSGARPAGGREPDPTFPWTGWASTSTGATCTATRSSAAAPRATNPRWRTSTATPGTSTSTTSGR